jgi:hypothetical protein
MTRARWALAVVGTVSALGGGAAGAVLYTTLAATAAPAASVLRVSAGANSGEHPLTVPLAASSPKPAPAAGTRGNCPQHPGSGSTTGS